LSLRSRGSPGGCPAVSRGGNRLSQQLGTDRDGSSMIGGSAPAGPWTTDIVEGARWCRDRAGGDSPTARPVARVLPYGSVYEGLSREHRSSREYPSSSRGGKHVYTPAGELGGNAHTRPLPHRHSILDRAALLAVRSGWSARDQRKPKVTLPVRTRRHWILLNNTRQSNYSG
jgi:hypothetical protein